MRSGRAGILAVGWGLLHATVLVIVALDLGYAVGPTEYPLFGIAWRYGGLVVVAAVPAWLALRHRIVLPMVGLLLTTGYVLGLELTPPGPTFRDVAELERLDHPTGITVVENGLYIVRYMVNASVWTVGFLFLGGIEYALRSTRAWLPDPRNPIPWLSTPMSRRHAAKVAVAGGLLHAIVMVLYAARLGVTVSGGLAWLLYPIGTAGMVILAAVPLYLLGRQQLVLPASLLTGFVLLDAFSDFRAGVENPHVLYFAAWFGFLGVVLFAALIEDGGRRLDIGRHLRPDR